ncbi:unnamed protein product [Rhodiola kirilowii]
MSTPLDNPPSASSSSDEVAASDDDVVTSDDEGVEEPVREDNSSSFFCLSDLAKTRDVGMMGFSLDIFKKGFELMSDEAKAAFEEKWKNLVTAELQVAYKRLELSCELMKLVLEQRRGR